MGSRSFKVALADLASAQKSKRGVSFYSRFVNRPLGRILAAASYKLGLSPNGVTLVSAIITALGMLTFVSGPPSIPRALGTSVFLVLGFALDSADGQVARLTGRGSVAGEWLDHVVDSAKIVAIHGSVLVSFYLYSPTAPAWLLVPLAFQVVSVVIFFGGELERHLAQGRADAAQPARAERPPSTVRALALLPADYGILALSFLTTAWPTVFEALYLVLFVANAAIMALLLNKWFAALKRLG